IQYQNVSATPHINKLWISVGAFQEQTQHFAESNLQFLSIDEALDFMERKKTVTDGRPISLTFDNGYQDFQENVLPVLSKHQWPATLLINPSRVGKSAEMGTRQVAYLSWNTLREMTENNITIGAYEDDAWNINKISQEAVREHIISYKKTLEDELGAEIRYFGVKEGVPSRSIRDLLVSEGYRAFLTQCPTNRRPDLYSVGRIQVDDDDFNIFLTKISKTYLFFKDKRSWKYIRKYRLDKLAHRVSETYDRLRGKNPA
ncbi:MAG: polysaccharide deacetylase family protein, partial [Acidobacteriota bacterium]